MCGAIADYNAVPEQQYPLRAYASIFSKRLTERGFIVSDKDIAMKYAKEPQERVQKWIEEGLIRVKMWEVQGTESVPEAFLALFTDSNFGKVVLGF